MKIMQLSFPFLKTIIVDIISKKFHNLSYGEKTTMQCNYHKAMIDKQKKWQKLGQKVYKTISDNYPDEQKCCLVRFLALSL